MKKLVFTYLLLFGFLRCDMNEFEGECPEPTQPYFDIIGLTLIDQQKPSDCCAELITTGKVPFDQHQVQVQYDFVTIAQQPKQQKSILFMNSSFALSCIGNGYKGSKETLERLSVTANFDIDDEHPANSSIDNLLFIRTFEKELSLADYIEEQKGQFIEEPFLLFRLIERPQLSDSMSFNVSVQLTNGEAYTSTTQQVIYE